jgi:hypothetical protein
MLTHKGVSKSNLVRYLAYLLQHALADGGSLRLEPDNFKAAVILTKREHQTKPSSVVLKVSSGYVDRAALANVADRMTQIGFHCDLKYTKSRHLLHSLRITLPVDGASSPATVVDTINKIFGAFGVGEPLTYTIDLYGPLKRGYSADDGDVFKRTSNYMTGYAIGFVVGKFWRMMRGA